MIDLIFPHLTQSHGFLMDPSVSKGAVYEAPIRPIRCITASPTPRITMVPFSIAIVRDQRNGLTGTLWRLPELPDVARCASDQGIWSLALQILHQCPTLTQPPEWSSRMIRALDILKCTRSWVQFPVRACARALAPFFWSIQIRCIYFFRF
jgi:hypothetical protein